MEEEEPEGTVSIAAPALPTLERCVCLFRKRPKVVALLPPPTKLEGCRVSVCQKCCQPRMVPIKPAPSPAKIAAKLAKTVRVAEEARLDLAQEAIVEDKALMHRHSVGDKVARALTPARPTRVDWLARFQVVVYYPGGKLWKERFYHGVPVVAEVGDTVLREWDDEEFGNGGICTR